MNYQLGKRLFDLATALLLGLLLLPLMLIVAGLVRIMLGGPILFCQERPGRHGKPFVLYKFRTMRDSRDQAGNLLPDGERLTAFGHLLRSTSMDELPELFNVLRGEMSLVGPRPLLMEYLARYTPQQWRRHAVLPGITGWAQVNGRNAITWERKFELDIWYVDHVSFWLDLKILALTVGQALSRAAINQPGQATVEKFMGASAVNGATLATNGQVAAPRARRVLIIGAGGHAQVVADILLRTCDAGAAIDLLGYLDDNPALAGQCRLGLPVLGTLAQLDQIAHDAVVIGIGHNPTRSALFEQLRRQGESFLTACHPRAIIAPDAVIGAGSVVCAGAVVNPGSRIGANTIINTAASVDHHNRIGDHAHVAPGAHLGGDVVIGSGALIGIGATVMPQCTVGTWSIVGAGALVHREVPARLTVIGVPARPQPGVENESSAADHRRPAVERKAGRSGAPLTAPVGVETALGVAS